jgi:hypothetical protein
MHRALGSPIMRPKSVSTDWIEQTVRDQAGASTGAAG